MRRRDDEWPTLRADKSTVCSLTDVIWKTTFCVTALRRRRVRWISDGITPLDPATSLNHRQAD
jgi:hypothetical protein